MPECVFKSAAAKWRRNLLFPPPCPFSDYGLMPVFRLQKILKPKDKFSLHIQIPFAEFFLARSGNPHYKKHRLSTE